MEGVTTSVIHGDARDVLLRMREDGLRLHACITDPPYELGLHALEWDRTGIAHDPAFWGLVRDVLLPGAFVVALSSLRRYHHLAIAVEQAGLIVQAPVVWLAGGGLPAGTNVAELIDRRLAPRRRPIGEEKASGRALANGTLGAQARNTTTFRVRRRGVSAEARTWMGHHHGPGILKPDAELILVAQVPIDKGTMLEHVAEHATGTVNIGRYRKARGEWPSAVLRVPRARGAERYGHATAKPQRLMEELCMLFAPPGGTILDPFGGSGTTGAATQGLGFDCVVIERDHDIASVAARRLGVPVAASHVPVPHPVPWTRGYTMRRA
jgi:site-specific DNA-methyltransferase (adenine-specific)